MSKRQKPPKQKFPFIGILRRDFEPGGICHRNVSQEHGLRAPSEGTLRGHLNFTFYVRKVEKVENFVFFFKPLKIWFVNIHTPNKIRPTPKDATFNLWDGSCKSIFHNIQSNDGDFAESSLKRAMSVMLIDEPFTKEARTPLITTTDDKSLDWRKFAISFIFK